MDDPDDIDVTLTRDEALVLFEWLHRASEQQQLSAVTIHPAELVALESLSALLEQELVEPFDPAYGTLVDAARERLLGNDR